MKLYFSVTSPYTRKVIVVGHETGLADRLELIPTVVNAMRPNLEFARLNPLMKLPTLMTDDGQALFDSPVICRYLDSLHGGPKLVPPDGAICWQALRLEALADGMTDAAMLCRNETTARPADKRWSAWIDGQMTKVVQGLDAIEQDSAQLDAPVNIGQIALACSIGWMEFRNICEGLREHRPRLFTWHDRFARRTSLVATAPTS